MSSSTKTEPHRQSSRIVSGFGDLLGRMFGWLFFGRTRQHVKQLLQQHDSAERARGPQAGCNTDSNIGVREAVCNQEAI